MDTPAQGRAPFVAQAQSISSQTTPTQEFQHCLRQYAIAALGVAGVTVVAAAQVPANKIIYTPVNIPIDTYSPTTIPIDFNHDGITDLNIIVTGGTEAFSGHGGASFGSVLEIPVAGNLAIAGHAIPKGAILDMAGQFVAHQRKLVNALYEVLATSSFHTTNSGGPFRNVNDKYLGVKFVVAGETHEGWIRISLKCHKGNVSGSITGYAFDTVGNEGGLAAGQIFGTVAAAKAPATIPIEKAAPGSLGMLAAGSEAIPYWRQ